MKRAHRVTAILFVAMAVSSQANAIVPLRQDHSHVATETALDPVSVEQARYVSTLIQVWAFLKFHHAAATTGRVAWDSELIRMLPVVARAKSNDDALALIEQWVVSAGKSSCRHCPVPRSEPGTRTLSPPIDWIRDEKRLGRELSAALVDVYEARAWLAGQHFVALAPDVGNPLFPNEIEYPTVLLPAASLRVLAVARIWSTINYWFPYRHLVQQPWESVLPEAIDDALSATSVDAYHRALLRILAKVNDGHIVLYTPSDKRPPVGECHISAIVRPVEAAPTVVSASLGSGLKPGDRIVAVDGKPVLNLMSEWLPYYAASSSAARFEKLSANLMRGDCEKARLTISRDGKEMSVVSPRKSSPPPRELNAHDVPGPALRRLSGGITYVKISQSTLMDVGSHLASAEPLAGLIVDLRGYPREFVLLELTGLLISKPTPFARISVANLAAPGAFALANLAELVQPKQPRYTGRVVALIDESTQSQAEYTAMALRAAGAKLIGTPSAGADGDVSRLSLPGGLSFRFTGIGIYYPNGEATQGVGLIPDVQVAPTNAGVRDCVDEVLEAAIRLLGGSSSGLGGDQVPICRNMDAL